MSFSSEWEDLYAAGSHNSVWPWSELISLVMRHAQPHLRATPAKVLEIGCGVGANIPLVHWFGGDFYGVDNSASAIEAIRKRFGDSVNLAKADFCEEIPFPGPFDLVIDRASLTHNTTTGIENCLEMLEKRLAPNGIFIGIHWFSTSSDDYEKGESTSSSYLKTGYKTPPFAGVGHVHFFDQPHIEHLFSNYSIEVLEHVVNDTVKPSNSRLGWWNIVARKKT